MIPNMKIQLLLLFSIVTCTLHSQLLSNSRYSNKNDVKIAVKGNAGAPEIKVVNANENGTYSIQAAENVITPGHFADIRPGDLNGDGYIDFIFNGNGNGTLGKGIALNDGTGIYSRSELEVTTATISCGIADLDNNGLMDYFVIGNGAENIGTVFFQNVDGTFTKDQSSFAGTNLVDADITTLDFNNDGSIDLFVCGWDENAKVRYAAIHVNDGNGRFTIMTQPNLIRKGYGSASWADVDSDGWLDLLLNGDGGTDGEASNNVYRLYKNNKGVLEPKATFADFRQISVGDGSRLVDWDNDGKTDIILTGWSASLNRQVTALFTGASTTDFTFVESPLNNTDFPGVSEGSIETADLNNDGRIDLLITGFSGNQSGQPGKYNRNICGYYLNQSSAFNTKPSSVPGLAHSVSGSSVTLSWNAATDDKTRQVSLTYNLSLRNTTTGKWLYNPMAVMTGATNGWRRVAAHGNVYTNRRWTLNNLPEGTYEWTVQAIDANFAGGAFAIARTFTINSTSVKEIFEGLEVTTLNGKILIGNKTGDVLDVSVYTITGSLLSKMKTNGEVDLPMQQGIYILNISNGLKNHVRKIIL